MGHCGKLQSWQRMRETGVSRLLAGVESLIDPTKRVGLLTYANTLEMFEPIKHLFAVTGWWFNHSRGTNIYQDCDQLILHGRPTTNINEEKADFHVRTGKLADGDNKGQFWAYQHRGMLEEVKQAIGRVRAHRRPDQQIEIVLIAGDAFSDDQISDIQKDFPGMEVEVVHIAETCPQAAKKGTRTSNEMLKVMWELVQSGAKVTIDKVALLIGKSKSCVSEKVKELTPDGFKGLVKSLVLLYRALKAKLNLEELDEDTQYIAESLRSVGVELSQGKVSAEEAAANIEILVAAYSYSKVFAALTTVPRWILRDYFKAFLLSAITTISETLDPVPIPLAT